MGRSIMRYLAFLCSLAVLASVGGVFATWHYTADYLNPAELGFPVTVTEFSFSDISQEETEEVTKSLAQKFLEILNRFTTWFL